MQKDENLASYSVNTNSNVAFNTTVSTTGIVTPVVEKNADIISIEGDVITVNYGQDMSGNAKDVENYKIDGKSITSRYNCRVLLVANKSLRFLYLKIISQSSRC
ncbi:hypothetical protein ACT7DO_22895 [Bacillus pacificus]